MEGRSEVGTGSNPTPSELIVLIRLLLTPIFNRSFNFFTLEISLVEVNQAIL